MIHFIPTSITIIALSETRHSRLISWG